MIEQENTERPYIAFYKDKKLEVIASTSYEAQVIAAQQFKAKKRYDVSVYLGDVVHSTAGV